MLADLISSSRAQQNSTLAALGRSNPAYLASLITTASDAIRLHCHREFVVNSFSEYRNGGIYIREPLKLRQYPVKEISRFATMQPCLLIQNGSSVNQRAFVETLSNGDFKLTRVSSGATTPVTLAAATYVTVGAMAGAINALGNGWGTSILSGPVGAYNNFPTTDLKPLQGAASALVGGCWLEIAEDWYGWNSGSVWPDDRMDDVGGQSAFWRLDGESGELEGRFPRGKLNLRIDYTAGFDTVPASVQEACVQLCQWQYQSGQINQTLKSAKLGNTSAELNDSGKWPTFVRNALSYFVVHDRMIE